MNLFKLNHTFNRDEDGAVTVDWVVLTAAIVGLAIAVIATISTSTDTLGDNVGTTLDGVAVEPFTAEEG
nr:hypothetical protein [uncultured Celeribacter sp.]